MDTLTGVDLRDDLGLKRSRIKYNVKQVARLETVFNANRYPDTSTLDELALEMGVAVERISIWFQNRRSKLKRKRQGDHVSWMRQQIFQVGAGTHSASVLPATSVARHVLSPIVSKSGAENEHNQRICSRLQVDTITPAPSCPETTRFDHILPYPASASSAYFQPLQHVSNSSQHVPNSSQHVPISSQHVLNNSNSIPSYCISSVEHSGKENFVQHNIDKTVKDKPDLLQTTRIPLFSLTNTIAYSDCRYQGFDSVTDWEKAKNGANTNVLNAMNDTSSVACIQPREELWEQYHSVLDQSLFTDSDTQPLDCLQQWD